MGRWKSPRTCARASPVTHAQNGVRPRCYWRQGGSPTRTPLRWRLQGSTLLALFRALDRLNLTPDQIPQRLIRQLFELDADFVGALWGLDRPLGKLNTKALLRDTSAALDQ